MQWPPSRQSKRQPWIVEELKQGWATVLASAVDRSTHKSYTSALNSWISFVEMHHFPIEPNSEILSFFIVYMSHHINPRSVKSYLSGLVQQLELEFLLLHSFYFYFYFEHLNFTWSYLIDLLISWSLDHIDLILTILSWRSYLDDLRSYLDLLILSSDDDPRYISFTLLLTCIWHAFDSCLSFMIDMHSTHVVSYIKWELANGRNPTVKNDLIFDLFRTTSHKPVPTARLRSASPAYSTDSGLAGGDAPRPLAASQQWKQSPIPIINTVSNPNSPHSLQSQLNTQSSI